MLRVDQGCVGCLGLVVPLARCGFSASVLRGGDDFEILVLQFLVNFLPSWQIEAAPSPGCPGDDEDLLATEVREADHPALAIGYCEIGRHTGA